MEFVELLFVKLLLELEFVELEFVGLEFVEYGFVEWEFVELECACKLFVLSLLLCHFLQTRIREKKEEGNVWRRIQMRKKVRVQGSGEKRRKE